MRKTQFDKLKEISPCPVKIAYTSIKYSGEFRWGNDGDEHPYKNKSFKPSITINNEVKSKPEQVATLIHEIGHALHHRRQCECYKDYHNKRALCEYHAEKFALRFMLRYKLKGALRFEMNYLKHGVFKCSTIYREMAVRLQQEKIWKKCEDYLSK